MILPPLVFPGLTFMGHIFLRNNKSGRYRNVMTFCVQPFHFTQLPVTIEKIVIFVE
jgi:hypothetical protein